MSRGVLCGETRLIDSLPEMGKRKPSVIPITCAHVGKTGKRCAKNPVEGETVCVLHGGTLEGANLEVRRRMVALQLQSLDVAEELIANGEDRVRATLVVATWDRTGLGPKSTLEVKDAPDDLSELSREELAARAEAAAERLRRIGKAPNRTHEDFVNDVVADTAH
jgi:hypothetical protein